MRRNDDCGSSFRNRDNGRCRAFRCANGVSHVFGFTEESLTDMKATIYHNPMCGTSRKTLDILRNRGRRVGSRISQKSAVARGA